MAWNTTLVHSCSSCVSQHIDRCLFVSRLCCTFAIVFWVRGSRASCLYSFHFTRQVSIPCPRWSQVFIHTFMPLSSHAATHPLLWNAVVVLTTFDLFYYCSLETRCSCFSPSMLLGPKFREIRRWASAYNVLGAHFTGGEGRSVLGLTNRSVIRVFHSSQTRTM